MNGTETENQESNSLELGDNFSLPVKTPVLLGRSDSVVDGYQVHAIAPLMDNTRVSRFAIVLESNEDKISIGIPKLKLPGGIYEGSNTITVYKTDGTEIEISKGSDSPYMDIANLAKIRVGDKEAGNGFILAMDGANRMKLTGVVDNNVETHV